MVKKRRRRRRNCLNRREKSLRPDRLLPADLFDGCWRKLLKELRRCTHTDEQQRVARTRYVFVFCLVWFLEEGTISRLESRPSLITIIIIVIIFATRSIMSPAVINNVGTTLGISSASIHQVITIIIEMM